MISANGQVLAYIGDAVLELLIREYFIQLGVTRTQAIHDKTVMFTSASGQQKLLESITQLLTDEEESIVKRGRNAPLSRKPRSKDLSIYAQATGLEALFGYLHLSKNQVRIKELFSAMVPLL